VCEDWVEEYSEAARELDVVTGVSQPRSAESRRLSSGEESRVPYGDGWRGGVWIVGFAVEASPVEISPSSTSQIMYGRAT
jgi:hypothetical protein